MPSSVVGTHHVAEKTQHLYTPPCKELRTSGKFVNNGFVGYDALILQLDYMTNTFKIIVNTQAFSVKDLWSQIGGFIGIFLGYSLLQVNLHYVLIFINV